MNTRTNVAARTVLSELLEPLFPPLRRALDALPARPAALVVVSRECADALSVEAKLGVPLQVSDSGHHYAAAPLERVRAVVELPAPAKTGTLDVLLPATEVWCLVVGPRGVVVVPVGWSLARSGAA